MPELAEVKLTADYVNQSAKSKIFTQIKKKPQHKGEEVQIPYQRFQLHAESLGKEFVLFFLDANSENYIPMRMTMGMSGHFKMTPTGQEVKHSHLMFLSECGMTLSFVDVRRFGKWKLNYSWFKNRGPCPLVDSDSFIANIMDNLDKKIFEKPLFEILMNQQYFNGIGNYLRAEIMYRLPHINPFQPARKVLEKEPKFYQLCHDIPALAYRLGGGKIKSWENPLGDEPATLQNRNELFQCYGKPNMSKVKDKSGRTFWYDPKWDQLDMETEWDYYSGLPNPKVYETIN